MKTEPLTNAFDERLQEIDAYLELLDALQRQLQSGPATIGGSRITAQQQKILFSSVYLQLYNLVEATATWCITAVTKAIARDGKWFPADLTADMRREWVRAAARTHIHMNADNRLQTTIDFLQILLKSSRSAIGSLKRVAAVTGTITNWRISPSG